MTATPTFSINANVFAISASVWAIQTGVRATPTRCPGHPDRCPGDTDGCLSPLGQVSPHRKKHAAKPASERGPMLPIYDSGAAYDSGLCYADDPVVPIITTQTLKGRRYMAGNPVPTGENDLLALGEDTVVVGRDGGLAVHGCQVFNGCGRRGRRPSRSLSIGWRGPRQQSRKPSNAWRQR